MSPFFWEIVVWLSRITPICLLFKPMGICDVVGSGGMHWRSTDWWRRKIASCFSRDPWWSAVGRKVLHETTQSSCGEQGVRTKARILNLVWGFHYCVLFSAFPMCGDSTGWWCWVQAKKIFIIQTVIHCTFANPWYLLQKIAQCQQMQQAKSSNAGCSHFICGLGF